MCHPRFTLLLWKHLGGWNCWELPCLSEQGLSIIAERSPVHILEYTLHVKLCLKGSLVIPAKYPVTVVSFWYPVSACSRAHRNQQASFHWLQWCTNYGDPEAKQGDATVQTLRYFSKQWVAQSWLRIEVSRGICKWVIQDDLETKKNWDLGLHSQLCYFRYMPV